MRRELSSHKNIEVIGFDNLLIDLANDLDAKILIRGLRVVSDFEYEYQMLGMNRQMDSEIETVFLMADAQRQSISSNFVKEIARLGGDISNFTNEFVSSKLKRKICKVIYNLIKPFLVFFLIFTACYAEETYMANDPENTIQIELKDGNVIIELMTDIA